MEIEPKNKSKRSKKGKSKISFDEELVTKDDAKELFSKENNKIIIQQEYNEKSKKKRKKNEEFENTNNESVISQNSELSKPKKKKQKLDKNISNNIQKNHNPEKEDNPDQVTKDKEKKESKRALKRKKHAQLLQDKKVQIELELQQKALNYLSKWKHSRSEWKFEKLRQIWLQQNLFDSSKIPNEYWDSVVQYFSGAKGHSKQTVLDEALKFIENYSEENTDEDYQIKMKRARDIVQNLEEK